MDPGCSTAKAPVPLGLRLGGQELQPRVHHVASNSQEVAERTLESVMEGRKMGWDGWLTLGASISGLKRGLEGSTRR